MIVERQQHDGWGAAVVDKLSDDLHEEFPGQAGFSRINLYNIRDLYKTYKDDVIVQPLVAQIGSLKYLLNLGQSKTAQRHPVRGMFENADFTSTNQ